MYSVASACLLLQVFLIYFFTAMLKSGPDWHADGTALYYAMQLDWLVLPLGTWLRDFFWFTQFLTWSTLVLEYVGPFLLIAPFWPVRCLGVLLFASLHLGISATMRLGVFPWIDVTILLAFLPREVWDAAESFVRRTLRLPAWGGFDCSRGAARIASARSYRSRSACSSPTSSSTTSRA